MNSDSEERKRFLDSMMYRLQMDIEAFEKMPSYRQDAMATERDIYHLKVFLHDLLKRI